MILNWYHPHPGECTRAEAHVSGVVWSILIENTDTERRKTMTFEHFLEKCCAISAKVS